jgi:methylated-DNA-[protein]-cysteine S-methyltransferase
MNGTHTDQGIAIKRIALGPVETPLGTFGAVFTEAGLACLTFPGESMDTCERWIDRNAPGAERIEQDPRLDALAAELTAYLSGDLRAFETPVDLRGTPFQMQVWQQLLAIGYGETRSYADVATAIGRPAAVRAVGLANGANPVPIVVPCHRVIGKNGTLTGYGGGLPLKQQLLRIEGITLM